jgi:hypothetical protein
MPKPVPDGGVVPAHLANATNHNISLDMRWCSCKKTQSVTIARDCWYSVQFFAIAAALIDRRSDFYSRPLLSSLSCKAQASIRLVGTWAAILHHPMMMQGSLAACLFPT